MENNDRFRVEPLTEENVYEGMASKMTESKWRNGSNEGCLCVYLICNYPVFFLMTKIIYAL